MKLQKRIALLIVLSVLLPIISMTGFAAENPGIRVSASADTVTPGQTVTVTVSLEGYDETADPIRGIQIDVDVKELGDSVLSVADGGYASLIGDDAVTSNKAVYLKEDGILRLIYVNEDGTLPQPCQDAFQMTFTVNPGLTEAASIPISVSAKIQTTENRVTLNEEISISCVPGASTVNQHVKWYQASMNLEDIVSPNFYFYLTGAGFEGFVPNNNIGLQMWNSDDYAALNLAAREEPAFDAAPTMTVTEIRKNGGYWVANTGGIPAKNMADYQYVRAYAVDKDGVTHYTSTYEFSAQKYARYHYGQTDQNMRSLAIALMNYGAAAQVYFHYNADDLMNSFLAAEDQKVNFDPAAMEPQEALVPAKFPFAIDEKIKVYVAKAVMVGRIEANIYYYIDPALMKDGAAELLYWHEDDYAQAETLTADNCTGRSAMTANGSYYYGTIPGTSAKDLGDTFFCCVRLVDASGAEHYSALSRYSTHTYCSYHASSGTEPDMVELAKALGTYSAAAKVYFESR